MKKLLLFNLLCFVMIISLVSAAPPFQSTSNVNGLVLESAFSEYSKLNESRYIHVHVYNASTGLLMNSGVSCYYHLYSHGLNGAHIGEGTLASAEMGYEVTTNANNYTILGDYSTMLWCNTSKEGGFIEYSWKVTPNGKEPAGDIFGTFIYILFIASLLGLIYTLFYGLAKLAVADVTIYDVLISWMFLVLMIIVNYLGGNYLMATFVKDISSSLITAIIFTNGVLPAISFVVSIIIKSLQKKKVLTPEELTGRRLING